MSNYYENKAEIIMSTTNPKPAPIRQTITIQKDKTLIEKIIDKIKSKKPVKLSESEGKLYNNTLVSFCGADTIVFIDNKVMPDLTNIRWYTPSAKEIELMKDNYGCSLDREEEYIVNNPMVLVMDKVAFDTSPNIKVSDSTLTVQFANEYGQAFYRTIYGVNIIREIGGVDVDSVVVTTHYLLSAKDIEPPVKGLSPEYKEYFRKDGDPNGQQKE